MTVDDYYGRIRDEAGVMPTGVNQSDRITPKTRVAELAVAGGEPMFRQTIHVGRPNIGDPTAAQRADR